MLLLQAQQEIVVTHTGDATATGRSCSMGDSVSKHYNSYVPRIILACRAKKETRDCEKSTIMVGKCLPLSRLHKSCYYTYFIESFLQVCLRVQIMNVR